MKALRLNKIFITDIKVDEATRNLVDFYPSLDMKLIKFIKKFLSKKWGLITEKDKLINDVMCDGHNFCGVIGIYKFKKFLLQLSVDPDDSSLYIDYIGEKNFKGVLEIKRNFENLKI